MNDAQKLLLINKYRSGELSEQEAPAFFAWYSEVDIEELHRLLQLGEQPPGFEEASPQFLEQLAARLQERPKVRKIQPRTWWAAAAAVAVIAGSIYLLRPTAEQRTGVPASVADVAPGKNGAILTLAGGKQIVLDSLGNGIVASQNGTNITLQNGSLSYDAANASGSDYNTITTPPARQFRLTLPDGSKVWLNAETTIKYPTAFSGKSRTVEIDGEAYFEVAANAAQPFKVKMDGAEIDVLGTNFNINAYKDEPTLKATLLEGRIRTSRGTDIVLLQPGQQAEIKNGITVNEAVNISQVIAWKEGVFNFDQLGVEAVMRQLSRWYDIEVVYENGIPDKQFYGEIGRNLNLSQVLEGLKASGLHFRIENEKRLVILP